MSSNTELLERAAEALEYWTGTMHGRIIERDLKSNDLEALSYHLRQAEAEMQIQEDEFEATDVI